MNHTLYTTDMANFTSDPLPFYLNSPAVAIVFVIMSLCAIIGNVMLIIVVVKHFIRNKKRHLHNVFIVNLAVCELLILGYWSTLLLLALLAGYRPVLDGQHCVADGMTKTVMSMVFVGSLVSISFNRYLHVCHWTLYRRLFTLPHTVCWCLLIWIFSSLLALPPLWGGAAGSYKYNIRRGICIVITDGFTYSKIMAILYSSLPLCFILYFNFAIFQLWSKTRKRLASGRTLVQKEPQKRRKLIAKRKARVSSEKAAGGSLEAETVLEQVVQHRNEKLAELHDRGCRTIDIPVDRKETGIPPESIEDSEIRRKSATLGRDEIEDNEARSANSCSFAEEEITADALSRDSGAEERNSVIINDEFASGDTAESHEEDLDRHSIPRAEGASADCSELAETFGKDGTSLPRDRSQEDIETRDTDDTRKDASLRHEGPLSVAATTSSAASPLSSVPTPARKPEHPCPSKGITHHKQSLTAHGQQRLLGKKSQGREEAFARSLLIDCILTFITLVPYFVLFIVNSIVKQSREFSVWVLTVMFLVLCGNWIIYGAINPAFRRGYAKIFRQVLSACRRARARPHPFKHGQLPRHIGRCS